MNYRVVPSTVRRGRFLMHSLVSCPELAKKDPPINKGLWDQKVSTIHIWTDSRNIFSKVGWTSSSPNIVAHRQNIIGRELNSVPALDEAGTELDAEKGIVIGFGRRY